MEKLLLFIGCLSLMIQMGCAKYKTQFDGTYNDTTGIDINGKGRDHQIVYVENGKLYTIDQTLTDVRAYPNLPAGIVYAAINPAHTKIAYKTAYGNITIIDSSGVQITVLPATPAVTVFDWHPNNETLYLLDGLTLKFYGKTVATALTNFTPTFPISATEKKIYGVYIRENGSVLYLTEYYSGLRYVRTLVLDNISGADVSRLINDISVSITWLRSSEADGVTFGGRSGASVKSYRFYFGSGSGEEYLNNILYSAYAPDGQSVVSVSATGLTISGFRQYAKAINGAQVTALDW